MAHSLLILIVIFIYFFVIISAKCEWNFHEMDGKFCYMLAAAAKSGYTFDELRKVCAKFDAFPIVYPKNEALAKRMSNFIIGLLKKHFRTSSFDNDRTYHSIFLGYKHRNYTDYKPQEMILYEDVFGIILNRHIDYTNFVDLLDVASEAHNGTDKEGRTCVQQIFQGNSSLSDKQLAGKWFESLCTAQKYYVCMKKND